jgi:nucleotide-binding universal stress UspA family protein
MWAVYRNSLVAKRALEIEELSKRGEELSGHGPTLIAASPSERNRAEEQLRRRTEEWLRQQVPSIGDEAPLVEALFGDAGLEILSAVERYAADLLVIGHHGARPASGGFLGSVAEFLLRNGSGAVLTVSGFSRGQ